MGLFRHHDDQPPPQRYQMREKLMSIGDDFWIENESGDKVYKVDGKAFRIRDTFVLKDGSGNGVATIKEKVLHIRDSMRIECGTIEATVHKALIGIRDRYKIDVEDGQDLTAHGNFVDHEYEIERDGDTVATISKMWFRVRDTYGVQIAEGENQAFLLAVTVCVDQMARD